MSNGGHWLFSNFQFFKSERKGTLSRMRQMNTESGRNTLIFRGLVVWNSLEKHIRDEGRLLEAWLALTVG